MVGGDRRTTGVTMFYEKEQLKLARIRTVCAVIVVIIWLIRSYQVWGT